jgi:large subunit ribosomal protein L20
MAFSGRRGKKRQFRRMWITRISAACRQRDIMYSRFVHGLRTAGVELNRKELAELAISSPEAFDELVGLAREQLAATA